MVSTSVKNIYSIVDIKLKVPFSYKQILSCKALKFIADIHLNFNEKRLELLSASNVKQKVVDLNTLPESLSRPQNIRNGELAYELTYRKLEIISPTERELIKDAFCSSSSLFIADFENKLSYSWENIVEGQASIKDIINNHSITETDEDFDSETIVEKFVPLLVHPRNLFLDEKNLLIEKKTVSAAFFDFGLFFFHNAKKLVEQGYVPYIYLSGIDNHQEARLWNDVFIFAEEQINLPVGITKAVA